ncbi:hypothetical protein SDC9_56377 [bioreactor metagenome]|uniref:Uncharacterized protein n=1 Tax=bioreactor metagenome TaxID=1076179 RepID=A0A644X6X7_9ZZZZ
MAQLTYAQRNRLVQRDRQLVRFSRHELIVGEPHPYALGTIFGGDLEPYAVIATRQDAEIRAVIDLLIGGRLFHEAA